MNETIDHEPIWGLGEKLSKSRAKSKTTDVCVIGAGITGLTSAYLLAKEGKDVIVIDRLPTTSAGESAHTTAFLTSYFDTPSQQIEKQHSQQTAIETWRIGQIAINTVERIIQDEGIECDWQRVSNYILAARPEDKEIFLTERRYARTAGIEIHVHDQSPFSFHSYPVMEIKRQAKFQPVKYFNALTQLCKEMGVTFVQSMALSVEENTGLQVIKLEKERLIAAQDVVIATHYPFTYDPISSPNLEPYITYVISALIPKGSIPVALYQDTSDPYFYFRIDELEDVDLITLGGADHESGHTFDTDPYTKLEQYLQQVLPEGGYSITNQWSGEIYNSIDGIPIIGVYKPHHFIAAGWAGNGMTFGTIAAHAITADILNQPKPYKHLFTPQRSMDKGAYAKRGAKTAGTQAKDLIKAELSSDTSKLDSEGGTVISEGAKPIAVCRDKDGNLCKYSAFCTHMNCVIQWNKHEQTFDCPCHGSRFNTQGEVITGPATKNLAVHTD